MSIFGFIIVIGLVVDDAIVTAENVYYRLKNGDDPLEAATEGTIEVTTPVTFGAITTIVASIKKEKPKVVFAPHVETSTGVMFPADQVKAIADAAHSVGAVFVLDCIASGTYWVDMKALGIERKR